MITQRRWTVILLSLGLGLSGLLLIIRLALFDPTLDFPEDQDMLLLILGLITACVAIALIVIKEGMKSIRSQASEQTRALFLAEHRRFLRRLDHELKNPLTALRAGLGSLTLTLHDVGQREIVQTIADEAQRLSHLVNDLRKLAQIEVAPLDVQAIKIDTLFQEVLDFISPIAARELTLELPPDAERMPPLICDPDLLMLAIHNLTDNAVKYTHNGDRIHILVQVGSALNITVADTGIGIPEAEHQHIWEELYRGNNTQGIPGNGIGLALVKAIIERHYGQVAMKSEIGRGTAITLILPYP